MPIARISSHKCYIAKVMVRSGQIYQRSNDKFGWPWGKRRRAECTKNRDENGSHYWFRPLYINSTKSRPLYRWVNFKAWHYKIYHVTKISCHFVYGKYYYLEWTWNPYGLDSGIYDISLYGIVLNARYLSPDVTAGLGFFLHSSRLIVIWTDRDFLLYKASPFLRVPSGIVKTEQLSRALIAS